MEKQSEYRQQENKQTGIKCEAESSLLPEMFPRGITVPLKCFKNSFYFQQIRINVYKRW
jgi:hypothetical protein